MIDRHEGTAADDISVYGVIGYGTYDPVWETQKCSECGRIISIRQVNDLAVELYGLTLEDFVWPDSTEILVSARLHKLLKISKLTGFDFRSVEIIEWRKRDRSQKKGLPSLYQLVVTGKGELFEDAGLEFENRICETCRISFDTVTQDRFALDRTKWDGSDIFTASQIPGIVFLTKNATDFLKENGIRGYSIKDVPHFSAN